MNDDCPGCREYPTNLYAEWLRAADRGIEIGLNANAVWRLHEKHFRKSHLGEFDLGGES